MRRKTVICLVIVPLLLSLVRNTPVLSESIGCDIGIHVQDDEGNPVTSTPVKLTSLTYGGYVIDYTGGDGVAVFDMDNWPNSCPGSPCCPPTWNYGNYRAEALASCNRVDFVYNSNNKHVDIVVGENLCK